MVDLLATTPARLFGLRAKGAIEVGRDADLVLFDPGAATSSGRPTSTTRATTRPYEGRELAVPSARRVRGAWVVRDGVFVGRRGHGRFVERQLDAAGLVATIGAVALVLRPCVWRPDLR